MAFLYHARYDGLRHNEGRVEVDVYHLAEFLDRHLRHGDALDDAGVVDQYVNHAQLLLDVGHHGLHLFFVGYVADVSLGVDALCLVVGQSLVHVLLAAAVERYLGACVGVCLGYGEAYAVGCSRDEGHLALEREFAQYRFHCLLFLSVAVCVVVT